jgi:hypothetical protein
MHASKPPAKPIPDEHGRTNPKVISVNRRGRVKRNEWSKLDLVSGRACQFKAQAYAGLAKAPLACEVDSPGAFLVLLSVPAGARSFAIDSRENSDDQSVAIFRFKSLADRPRSVECYCPTDAAVGGWGRSCGGRG